MRRVEWSDEAGAAFDAHIDWLTENRDEGFAARAFDEITRWTQDVANQLHGTPHSWRGFKTALYKREKRIIYRPYDDHIEIVAFRDTRQDNSAYGFVQPRTRT